jgi:hypothetical protein
MRVRLLFGSQTSVTDFFVGYILVGTVEEATPEETLDQFKYAFVSQLRIGTIFMSTSQYQCFWRSEHLEGILAVHEGEEERKNNLDRFHWRMDVGQPFQYIRFSVPNYSHPRASPYCGLYCATKWTMRGMLQLLRFTGCRETYICFLRYIPLPGQGNHSPWAAEHLRRFWILPNDFLER